VNQ
jgi:hypothetical protein